MTRGFAITGTDTNVGKTIVAAGLTAALEANYWKPIQAGMDELTDSAAVAELAGIEGDRIVPEAYRLKTPCSPHEAARIDNVSIEAAQLTLPSVQGPIIVEGAGGLLVPVNESSLMVDLFVQWALPVILVARTALGTINHSLLSIEALRSRALEIAGVLFVGEANEASQSAIITFGRVQHLGRLPWLDPLNRETLGEAFRKHVRMDLLRS